MRTEKKIHNCESCNYSTTNATHYKNHLLSSKHLGNTDKTEQGDNNYFSCNVCNFKTLLELNYKKHLESDKHTQNKDFYCKRCNLTMINKPSLICHKRLHPYIKITPKEVIEQFPRLFYCEVPHDYFETHD